MAAEKFCLKWNEFQSNVATNLRQVRDDQDFFDVTLACEDDKQMLAHKVVLAVCSSFFRDVLRRNRHDHPLIYLKGVSFDDLTAVLNFMYQGEVNVSQAELHNFLKVAEELKVKGLSQKLDSPVIQKPLAAENSHGAEPTTATAALPETRQTRAVSRLATPPALSNSPPPKRQRVEEVSNSYEPVRVKRECSEDQVPDSGYSVISQDYKEEVLIEQWEEVSESETTESHHQSTTTSNFSDINRENRENFSALVEPFLETSISKGVKLWLCRSCGYSSRLKEHVMNHVEQQHAKCAGYSCPFCQAQAPTYQALYKHYSRNHKR